MLFTHITTEGFNSVNLSCLSYDSFSLHFICLSFILVPRLVKISPRVSPVCEIAVHLAVAGDVYDGASLWCPFSHEMSWMRSWT